MPDPTAQSTPVIQATETFDRLVEGIQNLPWGVHAVAALAFVAGLVLWLRGRSVLKPVVAMLGAAGGAAIGFVMIPFWAGSTGVSPYIGLGAGLAIGLILSLMLYTLVTAVTFGSVMGGGFGLAAAAIVGAPLALPSAASIETFRLADDPGTGLGGGEQRIRLPEPELEVDPIPEPWEAPAPKKAPASKAPAPSAKPKPPMAKPATIPASTATPPSSQAQPRAAGKGADAPIRITADSPASDRVIAFWQALKADVGESWNRIAPDRRMWIVGASVVGLGAGTVLGLMLPMWAAGAITALVGAAVWVPAGVWLAHATSVPGHERLSLSPIGWTVVWIAAALVGMAIQWRGLVGGDGDRGGGRGAGGGGKRSGRKRASKSDEE